MGIEFEMHTHVQENLDEEEDEEMSGDEGDEIDEDENDNEEEDEEDNDLEEEEEEDDVHHLPHHDTDQDDHELEDDEFEEEILVEEDEEDEDDDDRVILRFEDGINGLNVLDHLEVLRDHRFSDETLHVMPVEVFGSRRQGRTTSIYSLLGRTGDGATPSQHPLLSGSPSLPVSQSQTGSPFCTCLHFPFCYVIIFFAILPSFSCTFGYATRLHFFRFGELVYLVGRFQNRFFSAFSLC